MTVQMLSLEFILSRVKFMNVMPDDSFIICSKKLYCFDNEDLKKQLMLLDESCPVSVMFNDHFKNFMVLTKYDVRTFNPFNGKMDRAFADLIKPQKGFTPRATIFAIGSKNRKFYLGDNMGNVVMFNTKNGEFLKKVNNIDQDYKIAQKFATSSFYKLNETVDREISNIFYLPDEKLLIVTVNSLIFIYDEIDSEESRLLKIFIGGHEEADITSICYCHELTYLVTGSANGIVNVWDLETSNHAAVLYGTNARVVGVGVLKPFGALAVCSADGQLCIWELSINSETKFRLLARFVVPELDAGLALSGDAISSLCYMMCWSRTCKTSETKPSSMASLSSSGEGEQNTIPPKFIEYLQDFYKLDKSKSKAVHNSVKHSQFLELYKLTPSESVLPRCFCIIATEEGNIVLADLYPFLHHLKIADISKTSKKFNPQDNKMRRQDQLNVSKLVSTGMSTEIKRATAVREVYDILKTIALTTFKAHDGKINSIAPVNMSPYFSTCGVDQGIKIWTLGGDLDSEINLKKSKPPLWKFKFDWIYVILLEFQKVFKNLEEIEGKKYPQSERDAIVNQFLYSNYIDVKEDQIDGVQIKQKLKGLGAFTEKLLGESIRRNIIKKTKETRAEKQEKEFLQKVAVKEMQDALYKSSSFRVTNLRNNANPQSSLGLKLNKEFTKISKEIDDKVTVKNFGSISSRVIDHMRKNTLSRKNTIIDFDGDNEQEDGGGKRLRRTSTMLLSDRRIGSNRNIPGSSSRNLDTKDGNDIDIGKKQEEGTKKKSLSPAKVQVEQQSPVKMNVIQTPSPNSPDTKVKKFSLGAELMKLGKSAGSSQPDVRFQKSIISLIPVKQKRPTVFLSNPENGNSHSAYDPSTKQGTNQHTLGANLITPAKQINHELDTVQFREKTLSRVKFTIPRSSSYIIETPPSEQQQESPKLGPLGQRLNSKFKDGSKSPQRGKSHANIHNSALNKSFEKQLKSTVNLKISDRMHQPKLGLNTFKNGVSIKEEADAPDLSEDIRADPNLKPTTSRHHKSTKYMLKATPEFVHEIEERLKLIRPNGREKTRVERKPFIGYGKVLTSAEALSDWLIPIQQKERDLRDIDPELINSKAYFKSLERVSQQEEFMKNLTKKYSELPATSSRVVLVSKDSTSKLIKIANKDAVANTERVGVGELTGKLNRTKHRSFMSTTRGAFKTEGSARIFHEPFGYSDTNLRKTHIQSKTAKSGLLQSFNN